ncbi:MAG: hypothetical protein QOJ94_2351 [Sphingomonadales bacterium]|jgi:hypothetical protein|nr:hypothetical protein [Sphingomonadales bacterium]
MGKAVAMTAVFAALAPATGQAQPVRSDLLRACVAHAVFRKAGLPAAARTLLPSPLADPDQPFQSSDVVRPGRNLPFRRLICAEPTRVGYTVRLERGGRGGGVEILFLRRRADGRFALDGPARRR